MPGPAEPESSAALHPAFALHRPEQARRAAPRRPSRLRQAVAVFAALIVLAGASLLAWDDSTPPAATSPASAKTIPLAVMGDSDSHSYQDRVSFPPGTHERGGPFREQTFQWTEVLARLRAEELDLGPWVLWGQPGAIALARETVGLPVSRAPPKEDYLYDFANSGAACKNLMGERFGLRFRQAPRLVRLMNSEPERWRRGAVIINIGGNDWYGLADLQAHDPAAPALREAVGYCAGQISAAIGLIHASHPATRILLVGLLNSANHPLYEGKYRSAAEIANLRQAMSEANAELREIADADPRRIAFIDPNPYFERRWGSRGPNGEPAYKTLALGSLRVSKSGGDAPTNTELSDSHWGVAANAIWAQAFVERLREAFGLALTPISDKELARFLAGDEDPSVHAMRVSKQ
jgi:hypothetical protein